MAEHPNAELWRRAQAALSRRDFNALKECWSDDVEYHVTGKGRLAGDYRGIQAVLALFRELTNLQIAEVHDVLASDEHVIALIRLTMRHGNKNLNITQANVYNVRDGKIAEAWLLPTDQAALDEFVA